MGILAEFSSKGLKGYRKNRLNLVSQFQTTLAGNGDFQTLTDHLRFGFLAMVRKQLSGEIE